MKARYYYHGGYTRKRKRKVSAGRLLGGTAFFIVSHLLIIDGLVHGMSAIEMVRWLGISFGVIFTIAAFIDFRN